MDEEFMSREERAELFSDLRRDIKIYFTKKLQPENYYIKRRINEAEDESIIRAKINSGVKIPRIVQIVSMASPDRWHEYEVHKNNLSKICGWDAGKNYDQEQYDKAMTYLIDYIKL
jgi:hypothetical protein